MNKLLPLAAAALFSLSACQNGDNSTTTRSDSSSTTQTAQASLAPSPADSSFIPVDSANRMIQSFLTSVSSDSTSLHSLILNANALRDYLTSDSGKNITSMKVMLAHTLTYINSGKQGVPCGYTSGDLTIVLAGYDAKGNYIYQPVRTVMDRAFPCPKLCPVSGTAASDLLP